MELTQTGNVPYLDPWITLTAAATERVFAAIFARGLTAWRRLSAISWLAKPGTFGGRWARVLDDGHRRLQFTSGSPPMQRPVAARNRYFTPPAGAG